MDFKEAQLCPVCKNKLSVDFNIRNKYQTFRCNEHFKGSLVNMPSSGNFIYESVVSLNNEFKLDLRYSEYKNNNKKYSTATIYKNYYKIDKNINDMIPQEIVNNFNIDQIYKYCQKILNNIYFI